MLAEGGPPSLGGSQPMGMPGLSGGPPLGPFGLLGQVSAWPAQHMRPFSRVSCLGVLRATQFSAESLLTLKLMPEVLIRHTCLGYCSAYAEPRRDASALVMVQGSAMGDGPEGMDMLSTLQAMSAHGGHMGSLPPMNPMQPPFSQQVLLHLWPLPTPPRRTPTQ